MLFLKHSSTTIFPSSQFFSLSEWKDIFFEENIQPRLPEGIS